jgi:hypothetical protein
MRGSDVQQGGMFSYVSLESRIPQGQLYYMGHTLMDHRHGLIAEVEVTEPSGVAERETALKLLDRHPSHERCGQPPCSPLAR